MQVIIGIAGLIGSGKDTVANHLIDQHNFKRIKFADKLKDESSLSKRLDHDFLLEALQKITYRVETVADKIN